MGKFILKRTGQTMIVLFIVSVFVFLMVSFLPGDPVYAMLGGEISQETYNRWYYELGLDQPLLIRYFLWISKAVTGNFGTSASQHMAVIEVIAQRLPVTLYLSLLAFFVSIPTGIALGVLAAINRGKKIDGALTTFANVCSCLPQFFLSVLFLYLFSMKMHWLPSFGFTWPWVDLGKSIQQTIMPLLCLAIGGVASICRQTRSSMLEVIGQDYIRTARSKGLKPDKIITVHALKNALIPVITLMGLRLGGMIGGSMFVESVFNISGMGTLLVSAIRAQDIPLIQACVLLIAVVACVVNIITDIVYAAVDPRIKV
ncbi:ABC transporter permease [Oribacterium sp. Sow4_G1_1]|uniref:ABC transporter permease n=1 Tax=Oribacterium sp. Sow4_G1_1 TaxID=3438794 RepID=UPI002A77D9D0|nr:ABC transporter permease [Oribacterium sp.]MDY2854984.1 ABC transporter permease [Oliverpabstia sp.]